MRSIFARVPLSLRQTVVLVAIFAALMWAIAHWLAAWHDWDWQFLDVQIAAPTDLNYRVAVVDMRYADPTQIALHRHMLATFLVRAARQRPKAIVLDIPFGECPTNPCDVQMTTSAKELSTAIGVARRFTPVYANVGRIDVDAGAHLVDKSVAPLDRRIYDALTGFGHTIVAMLPDRETQVGGDLFYYQCYPGYPPLFTGSMGAQDVWALADVATQPPGTFDPSNANAQDCDHAQRVAVRYGKRIELTTFLITETRMFPDRADFGGKDVIVGVPDRDVSSKSSHPGLDLLAWIVSAELDRPQFGHPLVQTNAAAMLSLTLAFSAIVALAFAAGFFVLKRRRLGGLRPTLPWIAAALALIAGVALFVGFGLAMRALGQVIYPQVALVLIGMILAALLCGVRGRQILIHDAIRSASPERTEIDYDVFISYAHEESAWVRASLYDPLKAARLADGRKLRVFFDADDIHIGEQWRNKIALSIEASRFIVPVWSDIYFTKNYCLWENDLAVGKWIKSGPDADCVLPIMRGRPTISASAASIQAIAVDDLADAIPALVAAIVERINREAVAR